MASTDFTNSIFIVTGAASGIGRHLALQAAESSALVIAADNNTIGLNETKQLALQQGLQIDSYSLDVADKASIYDFSQRIIPQLQGRKLILINNAGVGLFSGS